jgi:hypothetical protein
MALHPMAGKPAPREAKIGFFRPCGTLFLVGGGPAMNRWAIFDRPSGTSVWESVVPGPGWAGRPFYSTENSQEP